MSSNLFQFTDYSDEKSSVNVTSAFLTAANFDAQAAASAALAVAMAALSIGVLTRHTLTQIILDDPAVATNVFAQRELKWLVRYQANITGQIRTLEIPAAALTGNLVPNTDIADVTSTAWVNFISAFNAFARNPSNATEAVTFLDARLVGRNL